MMRIIEIQANELGGHDNLTVYEGKYPVPEGWAIIPDEIEIPETFPFVDIAVEGGIVTSMTAGVMPEPAPAPEPEPSAEDILNALLGVTE